MRVLYINDELATSDGSNYHARGILINLIKILGEDNVRAYPELKDAGRGKPDNYSAKWKGKHKNLLQMIRFFRKKLLSHTRSRRLCREMEREGWIPTHVIARSFLFDTTAVLVAGHFRAKLIYEVNAPMYYEHCVADHLPLLGAVEQWERGIMQKADCIYAVSSICRDMLCEHYLTDREKFIVIPNGYMEELYDFPLEYRQKVRNALRKQENYREKFVVAFIGSLKPWHGIDLLCEIAEMLEKNSNIHFMVAGNGKEYAKIEEYCNSHKNMTYKGNLCLEEMAAYLWASDLGIMPYRKKEHFYFSPLKMYDMIGAGLPFIGTDQGQIHELCTCFLGKEFLIEDCSAAGISRQIEELSVNREQLADMRGKIYEVRDRMGWHCRALELVRYCNKEDAHGNVQNRCKNEDITD